MPAETRTSQGHLRLSGYKRTSSSSSSTSTSAASIGAINVGAQSTLGTRHFCPKNMYEKLTKCPNFTCPKKLSKYPNFMIFAGKINKILILHDFCPKMPEFYMIIAQKYFPRFFFVGGGHVSPTAPVSYAYDRRQPLGCAVVRLTQKTGPLKYKLHLSTILF